MLFRFGAGKGYLRAGAGYGALESRFFQRKEWKGRLSDDYLRGAQSYATLSQSGWV